MVHIRSCQRVGPDLNGDGRINREDLEIILRSLGTKEGQHRYDPRADVNGDGIVNRQDVEIELEAIRRHHPKDGKDEHSHDD